MKTILEAAVNLCGGRFRLSTVIGQGPFATVYEALDQSTGQTCALKRLDRPLLRDGLWKALQRDAALVSRADTPGILVPFAAGIDERGCGYLAELRIPGESLAARLRRGALDFATALDLIEAVAERLDAAARVGVFHGDLKPSNVLCSPTGQIWLSDFGFGHLAAAGLPCGDAYGYQPPEWFLGAPPQTPTLAADVYGLGLLLFECLTGRPLYTPLSREEARRLLCEDPFPHLAMLPERQRELVALACERNPQARFAAPLAVARALRSTQSVTLDRVAPQPRETAAELRLPAAVVRVLQRPAGEASGEVRKPAAETSGKVKRPAAETSGMLREAVAAPDAPEEPARERQTVLIHGGHGGHGGRGGQSIPGAPGAIVPMGPEDAERARTMLWASRPPELQIAPPASTKPPARETKILPSSAALARAAARPAAPPRVEVSASLRSEELATQPELTLEGPDSAQTAESADERALTRPYVPSSRAQPEERRAPESRVSAPRERASSPPRIEPAPSAPPRPARRESSPRRPAPRSRGPWYLALVGGLLGISAVGVYMAKSAGLIHLPGAPRPARPPTKGKAPAGPSQRQVTAEQELLQEAQVLLEKREYAAAMGRTDLVLRNNPLQAEALALRTRAREGMNELVLCERLLRAVRRGDLENAATLFSQAPATSPCRSEVRTALAAQVPAYEETHAKLVRAAEQGRRCDEAEVEAQRMLIFSARPPEAIAAEVKRVGDACRAQKR